MEEMDVLKEGAKVLEEPRCRASSGARRRRRERCVTVEELRAWAGSTTMELTRRGRVLWQEGVLAVRPDERQKSGGVAQATLGTPPYELCKDFHKHYVSNV